VSAGYVMFSPFPGARARPSNGAQKLITRDGRRIEYFAQGSGPRLILLASAAAELRRKADIFCRRRYADW